MTYQWVRLDFTANTGLLPVHAEQSDAQEYENRQDSEAHDGERLVDEMRRLARFKDLSCHVDCNSEMIL